MNAEPPASTPSQGTTDRAAGARHGASGAAVRAFFALWPDVDARDALVKLSRDVAREAGGRPPVAENLHLTLAFLGEVPIARIPDLETIGRNAAIAVSAFDLKLDRIGMFRGSDIAWAGAAKTPADLLQLVLALNAALSRDGFVVDARPFHAHVTLARRCRRRSNATIASAIAWPVTRLVLNASDLGQEGARYRELAQWTLCPR